MTMSLLHALLVALFVALASADYPVYISVPSRRVAADTPFQATLKTYHDGVPFNISDTTYVSTFRVYLATEYGEKRHAFFNPDCYLIQDQTLCDPSITIASYYVWLNTTFTVTIPATVGPPGEHYVLIARVLNTDGSTYGQTWESDVLELTGANGTWSPFQKDGNTLLGDNGIPCGSYACVKNCWDAAHARDDPDSTSYQKCVNECPAVSFDYEASRTTYFQPTASLTEPSSCSVPRLCTTIWRKPTTDPSSKSAATMTGSAAAATGTGAAVSSHESRSFSSIGLVLFTILYLARW